MGVGGGGSQIIRQRENPLIYKSFNTLRVKQQPRLRTYVRTAVTQHKVVYKALGTFQVKKVNVGHFSRAFYYLLETFASFSEFFREETREIARRERIVLRSRMTAAPGRRVPRDSCLLRRICRRQLRIQIQDVPEIEQLAAGIRTTGEEGRQLVREAGHLNPRHRLNIDNDTKALESIPF